MPSLYTGSKEGVYRFLYGWNLRAFAAYLIAIAPNFYGFLNQLGVKAPLSIQRFYYVAYPVGLLIAFGFFLAFNLIFPAKGVEFTREWKEPKDYVDVLGGDEEITSVEGVPVEDDVKPVHVPGMGKKEPENTSIAV